MPDNVQYDEKELNNQYDIDPHEDDFVGKHCLPSPEDVIARYRDIFPCIDVCMKCARARPRIRSRARKQTTIKKQWDEVKNIVDVWYCDEPFFIDNFPIDEKITDQDLLDMVDFDETFMIEPNRHLPMFCPYTAEHAVSQP